MKSIKYIAILSIAAGVILFSVNARADEQTGYRKVVGIGCHHINGTCFVTLDGENFGGSLGCSVGPTKEFRFDDGDTGNGKRTFSSLLGAYLGGKSVNVYLSGCSSQGFPNLIYYNIQG